MLNEETGVRGYVISGDRTSLKPYRQARPAVLADLTALERLTTRRPEIAADVRDTRHGIQELESFYERQIALVAEGRAGRLRAQEEVLAGKSLFDRFRQTSTRLVARANAIVAEAHTSQRRTFWTTVAIALAAGTAAAAIALWLLLTVPRRIWSLYDVERDLREVAERGARAARSLAHVDDAVILLDPDSTVCYWNPAAASFFDVAETDALGRPVAEVVPELPIVEELLERDGTGAVVPITRGRGERWLATRESRFDEGRVLVFQDTTTDRQLERARSDFLATASHELRTPLAAVYGAVRTLRHADRAADPELDRRLLEMIETESDRLKELVEQILTSAEVDRGEVRLRNETCELRAICESAIEAVRARGVAGCELTLAASEEVRIEGDPGKLRQVVVNLLDNAVKYSPNGGLIEIRIHSRPGVVTIDVVDSGIGIPAGVREHIFEKFYRADPEMRSGVGGSGLGLYISRELVARMGGTLNARANPGAGSTFTVELPYSQRLSSNDEPGSTTPAS